MGSTMGTDTPDGGLADLAFCPRCAREVRVVRPWRGWKIARAGWLATMILAVVLFPFLSADYCYMLPTFMVILAAWGPIWRLASERPTCRRCNLDL
jgi:hypothetical protein